MITYLIRLIILLGLLCPAFVLADSQQITFSLSSNKLAIGNSITATATATSGLEVSFSSSTPDVCRVNGTAVIAIATGTCTIVANQAGTPILALSPASASLNVGATVQFTPTATDQQGNPITVPTNLQWTSTNAGVIVGSTGLVSASLTATGTALITVTDPISQATATTTVTISAAACSGGGQYVTQGGLTWTPNNCGKLPTSGYPSMTWSEANAYCTGGNFLGLSGWRLPTVQELAGLVGETITTLTPGTYNWNPAVGQFGIATGTGRYNSSALSGMGWTLFYTWSSTPYSAGGHYDVTLYNGVVGSYGDTDSDYVSCVR